MNTNPYITLNHEGNAFMLYIMSPTDDIILYSMSTTDILCHIRIVK